MTPDTDKAARELLAFYLEAGVDAPVGEEPVDRFADTSTLVSGAVGAPLAAEADPQSGSGGGVASRSTPESNASASPTLLRKGGGSPTPSFVAAPPPPDAAAMAARETVKDIATLEDLRAALDAFEGCALKGTAKQLVFADGNPQAKIMFVGEAPGRDEDIEGLPFVGRSGKLLDRMLSAIGLDRSSVYIANIIPWRPPGNRTPTPQETQICLPFIQRQIELVSPDVLVTLGNPSTQTLLSTREGIMKTRGRWFDYDTGTRVIRALATFHPAYLLRSPSYKRMAWQDLRAIAKALEQPKASSS